MGFRSEIIFKTSGFLEEEEEEEGAGWSFTNAQGAACRAAVQSSKDTSTRATQCNWLLSEGFLLQP